MDRPDEKITLPAPLQTPPPSKVDDQADSSLPKACPSGPDFRTVMRRLGPVSVLALIAAIFPALGGFALLGTMKWSGPWLREHPDGIAIYATAFAVLAGLALLPTYAQAALGGFAFGLWAGTLAALGGITGAAVIGYLIARRAAGERAISLIAEQPKWKAVYEALAGGGFWKTLAIVTLLRVPPNSPFAITNLVMAATRIPLPIYIIGTVVGIAPRTAALAFIGSQLAVWNPNNIRQTWFLVAGIIALLIVLGIIGTIANRAIGRVTSAQTGDIPPHRVR